MSILACSPEQLLGLQMGEAFLFRTIAGHPQPVFNDILTLDAQSHGFEDLILVYHTGKRKFSCRLPRWHNRLIVAV